MDDTSFITGNSSSDYSVGMALQNILDLDVHLNNRLLKLQMVYNQVMSLSSLQNLTSFKEHLTKMFALHVYVQNSLGNVNSHLSFGVNKKKSYQMCFDLFHKLDSVCQCNEENDKISNVYSI